MSYSNDELCDLKGRGSAAELFVASCLHLIKDLAVIKELDLQRMNSEIRTALTGIAVTIVSLARPERLGDEPRPIAFLAYSSDGFGMKVETRGQDVPLTLLSAFATDISVAETVLSFRVSRGLLEETVTDWLARSLVPKPRAGA